MNDNIKIGFHFESTCTKMETIFIGSLGHWVIGSLGHWVIGSLGHWVIRNSIEFQTCIFTND